MNFKDITSHQIACEVMGKDPSLSVTTDQKITDVCNAINKLKGNFKADFQDKYQKKYRPFFIIDASGFRFVDSGYVSSYSSAAVGSRLCHYVSTEEESDHLGTQFLELHKAHYLGE